MMNRKLFYYKSIDFVGCCFVSSTSHKSMILYSQIFDFFCAIGPEFEKKKK